MTRKPIIAASLRAGSVSRLLSEKSRIAMAPGSDTIGEAFDIFGRLRQVVDQITQTVSASSLEATHPRDQSPEAAAQGGRMVFGYNVSIGLNGLRMEPFGDVHEPEAGGVLPRSGTQDKVRKSEPKPRAPIVDIFDEGNTLTVIAELPGVSDADILCRLDGCDLHIKTVGPHSYMKNVRLPWQADAASLTQSCRNGILEVSLTRAATP